MRFLIKEVLPGDAEHLARIRDYLVRHWCVSPQEAEEHTTLKNAGSLPKMWVAILPTGTVAGHAMLALEPEGFCGINGQPWLQALFVDESLRQQGIGQALVGEVEQSCWRQGYQWIYLDTMKEVGFYRSRGWQIIGNDLWRERGELVTVMCKELHALR